MFVQVLIYDFSPLKLISCGYMLSKVGLSRLRRFCVYLVIREF
jgi:hypothetical protein